MAKVVCEKDVWKKIKKIIDRGGQSDVMLHHLQRQKKKAAKRSVDNARNYLWKWMCVASYMRMVRI